jgi:hypothetical protein
MEQTHIPLELKGFIKLGNKKSYHPLMFAILSWIIHQVKSEIPDELGDVNMILTKKYGNFGSGPFPTIGLVSDTIQHFDARYKLIEDTCQRLLKETSINDLAQLLHNNNQDWEDISAQIMGDE